MARTRVLRDVAKDPLAKKETVSVREDDTHLGIGHYALTMAIGLIAGMIGGLLSSRILKII